MYILFEGSFAMWSWTKAQLSLVNVFPFNVSVIECVLYTICSAYHPDNKNTCPWP